MLENILIIIGYFAVLTVIYLSRNAFPRLFLSAFLIVTFVGLVVVIVLLDLDPNLQSTLLALIGLVVSATIGLSSSTLLGNALAGAILRGVHTFRAGDTIRVGDHFGRVTERGGLHVRIQTEDSDIITLPNLLLVTNPVTVMRREGTIISAEISLGYDIAHTHVAGLLKEAGSRTGFEETVVNIVELGDFAVTYRIAGELKDVTKYLSTRSRLREHILDALTEGHIEIVSPTFMITRAVGHDQPFHSHPSVQRHPPSDSAESIEEIAFAEAEQAAKIDGLEAEREAKTKELEDLQLRIKRSEKGAERDELLAREEALTGEIKRLTDELAGAENEGVAEQEKTSAKEA